MISKISGTYDTVCTYFQDDEYEIFQLGGFSGVSGGSQVVFTVDGLSLRSLETADEYRGVVDVVVESLNAASVVLDQSVVYDVASVYTTSGGATLTKVSSGSPTAVGSGAATQGYAEFGYEFTVTGLTVDIQIYDQIVVKFPENFFWPGTLSRTSGLEGAWEGFGRWAVFTFDPSPANPETNATVSFGFKASNTGRYGTIPSNQKAKVYFKSSRLTTKLYEFSLPTIDDASLTVSSVTCNNLFTSSPAEWVIGLDATFTIPIGGCLTAVFPTGTILWDVRVVQKNVGTMDTNSIDVRFFNTGATQDSVKIIFLYEKVSSQNFTIRVTATNAATAGAQTITFGGWSNKSPDVYPTTQTFLNQQDVGIQGGSCTCGSSAAVDVGEYLDKPGTIACINGTPGAISQSSLGAHSYKKIICASDSSADIFHFTAAAVTDTSVTLAAVTNILTCVNHKNGFQVINTAGALNFRVSTNISATGMIAQLVTLVTGVASYATTCYEGAVGLATPCVYTSPNLLAGITLGPNVDLNLSVMVGSVAGYKPVILQFYNVTPGNAQEVCPISSFYVEATSWTTPLIVIDHLTSGDFMNRVTINVAGPGVIYRTGRISVDFANLGRDYLGGSDGSRDWADGTIIPCVLQYVAAIQEGTVCTVKKAAGFIPARVLIDYSASAIDFTAGIMLTIIIGRWKSPLVAGTLRIRVRYITFGEGNTELDVYSNSTGFAMVAPGTG